MLPSSGPNPMDPMMARRYVLAAESMRPVLDFLFLTPERWLKTILAGRCTKGRWTPCATVLVVFPVMVAIP
jgi:hypothetical protein